jgi:sugar-specific transcriptional regulator TrmB
MIDPVTGLMRLGLTEYEARAYVATVSIGEGGVGDISQESGIPRARVYDIMERLAGKGFVEVGNSKPLRYRANDPKRVAQGILTELQDTVDNVALQLNDRRKKASKSLTPVWLIPDDRGIDIKIKELLESATGNITVIAITTALLQKYAPMLSDVSHHVKVQAMIFHEAESFRGHLGATEIMGPKKSSLSVENELPIFSFPSQRGEREFKFDLVMASDSESLVVYRENEERIAMSIDDSIFDLILRAAIKESALRFKTI